MKTGLKIGDAFELELVVDESMSARFGSIVIHNLYSTASMLAHMEWAARQHILPYLEDGEEGVGYHSDLRHLNPTPVGAKVKIKSTVTNFDQKFVISKVEAWNDRHKIGEGSFTQALLPLSELHRRYEDLALTEEPLRPAVLWSDDFKKSFSLALKCFEHNFPCTRYDEWFVCVGELNEPDQNIKHEGPFLLKYETEELIEGLRRVYSGEQTEFKSDFLEPIFSMKVRVENGRGYLLDINLKQRDDEKHKDEFENVNLVLTCNRDALQQFCKALHDQLARFDSNL